MALQSQSDQAHDAAATPATIAMSMRRGTWQEHQAAAGKE
jgi:hypothetical protein